MSGSKVNWLPHLTNEMVPKKAHGNNLSMYSIALEGWRRGLKLSFFIALHDGKKEIQYSLEDKHTKHYFEISKGDKVKESAVEICNDKARSKELLQQAQIPTPNGRSFKSTMKDQEIISYAEHLGYPVVLKPTNGKLGRNVYTGINSSRELIKALQKIREHREYEGYIIEEYIKGNDYRIYVLDDHVLAVTKRVAANVVGDGQHTIEELIHIKNEERRKNPNLRTRLITIDEDVISNLEKRNYTLTTVLSRGERVLLRTKCNISSGGDPVDVTNDFPAHLKEIAVNAVTSIPGLIQSGVDMIVDSNNNGYIIEMNTRPGIGSHLFPLENEAIDIPKAIIDYYFPETKESEKINLFFDFNKIHDILRKGTLTEIVVSNVIEKNMVKKEFEVYGDVQSRRFENWLQKNTLNLNLNGFAKRLENDIKYIIVFGEKLNVEKFSKLLNRTAPQMINSQRQPIDVPLKAGFEIID